MSMVQTFERNMIREYLDDKELKYFQDDEENFLVHFAYDDDWQCELTVVFTAQGDDQEILTIYVFSSKKVPRRDWGRAIFLCNQWNKESRWPKAYLSIEDMDKDKTGEITLEGQLDLEAGIHQELFNDFSTAIIAASMGFWQWATQEQKL